MKLLLQLALWGSACILLSAEIIGLKAVLFPVRETVISSRIEAPARTYKYKIGEFFPAAAVLLPLDSARHQIELDRAKTHYQFACDTCCDQQQLHQKNLTSDYELKKARFERQIARHQLDLAQFNVDCCAVKAPFAGKIVEIFTREFENVRAGQQLCRIIDDRQLWAVIHVPVNHVHCLPLGTRLTLRISGVAVPAVGCVHEISPQADHRSQTVKLRVLIDNIAGNFTPGRTGEVCHVQ